MMDDSRQQFVGRWVYALDWLVFGFKRTPNNEAFQNVSARKIRVSRVTVYSVPAQQQVPAISKFTEEDFLAAVILRCQFACSTHVKFLPQDKLWLRGS